VATTTCYTGMLIAALGQLAFSEVPIAAGLGCGRLGQGARHCGDGWDSAWQGVIAFLFTQGVRCGTG